MMKFTASTALRWFGFRQTLVVNGLISGAFLAACALFTPSTPHWLLLLILLAGGFLRSLQSSPPSTPSAMRTSRRRR